MARSRSDIGGDGPVVDNRWEERKEESDEEKNRRFKTELEK